MSSPEPSQLRALVAPSWAAALPDASIVVLLLHGYGADERDLVGLIEPLGVTAPWASLRAPLDLPGGPGAAWFPIEELERRAAGPVEAATELVWAWVDAVLPASARVLPIGFSQGGLMATQLLRTRPDRVVAPVVLAGLTVDAPQPGDARLAVARPAAFWGRGDTDAVIPSHAIATAADFLSAHTTLTERVYPGLGHAISMAELADVAAFIAAETGGAVVGGR